MQLDRIQTCADTAPEDRIVQKWRGERRRFVPGEAKLKREEGRRGKLCSTAQQLGHETAGEASHKDELPLASRFGRGEGKYAGDCTQSGRCRTDGGRLGRKLLTSSGRSQIGEGCRQ